MQPLQHPSSQNNTKMILINNAKTIIMNISKNNHKKKNKKTKMIIQNLKTHMLKKKKLKTKIVSPLVIDKAMKAISQAKL